MMPSPHPPLPSSSVPSSAIPDSGRVAERLELMAAAVRRGQFDEAAAIGNSAHPPLAVPQSAIESIRVLSQGPNSTVRAAILSLQQQPEEEGGGREKTSENKKIAVAVKRVALRRPSDGAAFRAEVSALARVSAVPTVAAASGEHGNRVSALVGARALPPDFLILTPLCARGSAAAALSRLNDGDGGSGDDGDGLLRSWTGIVRLAGDVAQGVAAVHAAGLVHRDVKPENVLLDDEGRGVLCDLGVAIRDDGEDEEEERQEEDAMEEDGNNGNGNGNNDAAAAPSPPPTSSASPNRKRSHAASNSPSSDPHPTQPSGGHSRRHIVGTLEYLPPEVLRGHSKATKAADVYAWAVTANALSTRVLPPFADCDRPSPACHTVLEFGYGRQELVAAVAGEGLRPRLAQRGLPPSSSAAAAASRFSSSPSNLPLVPPPPRFLSLIERCWHADPRERPSAAEVARECRGIEEEVRSEEGRLLLLEEGRAALSASAGASGTATAAGREDRLSLCRDDEGGAAAAALLGTVGLDWSDDDDEEEQRERSRPWPSPGWALGEAEEEGEEGFDGPASRCSALYLPSITAAAFETIGRREAMEDAVLSCSPLYPLPSSPSPSKSQQKPAHLFAVFDGHRGDGAALYAARSLRRHLRSVWESSKTPEEALSRAFARLDARWRRREAAALALAAGPASAHESNGGGGDGDLQRRQRRHCGAAATAALVWGDSLTVANVGDCRGLLAVLNVEEGEEELEEEGEEEATDGDNENGDGSDLLRRRRQRQPGKKRAAPSWRPLRLTRDHSADDPAERARVEAEGGILIPPPSPSSGEGGHKGWRLGPVGLAVTRALGDADVPGCSALPFTFSMKLTPSCVALILMTDGVTEAMEARRGDATSFALEAKRRRKKEEEEEENGKGGNGERDETPPSPSELVDEEVAALVADTVKEAGMAARRLVVEAVEHRQGKDNAAALVAYLTPVESLERVF